VLAPFDGGKTPKEQQPSFLLGQFQIELRKPFPQLALEVLRVSPELEASHKIIRETHQVCLALALCFEFLFKPQVEREVQVDVTQHRRYYSPYAKGNLRRRAVGDLLSAMSAHSRQLIQLELESSVG
jgi:hypothetical protein